MLLRFLALFLCLLGACRAAEIVAWNTPLENYSESGLRSKGVLRLEVPPELSVLFNQGDELWDVSKAEVAKAAKLDWVVWNATTGRLVGKGALAEIGLLHRQLGLAGLANQVRILVEVFRSPDGQPVAEGIKPEMTHSILSRSDYDFESENLTVGGHVRMTGKVDVSEMERDVMLSIDFKCGVKDQPDLVLKTSLSMQSGKPMWVAGDGDGEAGLAIRFTTTVELHDGTPIDQLVLLQKGDRYLAVERDWSDVGPVSVGKGLLCSRWVDADFFKERKAEEPPEDPFNGGGTVEPLRIDGPDARIPPHLEGCIRGPLIDMKEVLRGQGFTSGQSDFAGYDPLREIYHFYTENPQEMEKFENLTAMLDGGAAMLVALTFEGPRQSLLVGRPGQKSLLQRPSPQKESEVIMSIEAESMVGESEKIVEVALDYRIGGPNRLRSKTLLLVEPEKPALIFGIPGETGLQMTAEIRKLE